jgi:hypothetical protein
MKQLLLSCLCLAFLGVEAQSEFQTLRSLQSKTAVELKFKDKERCLDEGSLVNFYSNVNGMYKSKEVCVAHKPNCFSGPLGEQRKRWFFDLLKQEQIEILSEKVYPFTPTTTTAEIVIYFKEDNALVGVKKVMDSSVVNKVGWEVNCLVEDLMVYAETRFKHFLDPTEELKGKITTTSSDGDFLKLHSVLDIQMPVGVVIRSPWTVTVLNDESKSKENYYLYVLSSKTGEWLRYSMTPVGQKKSGKSYFLEFQINESGTYAVAAPRKIKKESNVFYYKEKCAIVSAMMEDPRGEFVGPAVIMDNRRFVCLPTVDYPEDTYVIFQLRDLDANKHEERVSMAELIKLQKGWYRVISDVAEKWEARKKAQEEQVVTVNQ